MTDWKSGKKLVNFAHLELVNSLLKDECAITGDNESRLIENFILDHYLNKNRDISYAIYSYLYADENGLTTAGKSLFDLFASLPENIDDTVIPLLEFYRTLERRYPTNLNTKKLDLTHFMRCLDDIQGVFENYITKEEYVDPTTDGKVLKLYDLSTQLKSFDDLLDTFDYGKNDYPIGTISHILDLIINYLHLPLPDGRLLRNYTFLYRFLSDLMAIAAYPSTPEYRCELVAITKSINFLN